MIDLKESDILKNWKSTDILLSVNTMTYNHEKYIAQCIEGILMQKTNFAFELLIHDDASTDNTAAIIKEYEKKYPNIIKPIYQTENKWSKGIKISATYQYPRAKGKYIAVCEGDDYWIDENKLQMQVDFLENNPEYTMCFHSAAFDVIGDFDAPVALSKIDTRAYSSTEIFQKWTIPTASVVYNKNVLDFPVTNIEKILFGDIVLFEKCSHMGKIYGFSKKMSVYRIHDGGVSHNKRAMNKRRLALPKHYEFIFENFPLIDRKIVLKKIIRSYISCLVYCGNMTDKFCYVKNLIKYSNLLLNLWRKNGKRA